MIYMFLSNNPMSGDIKSSNLTCSNYISGAKNGHALGVTCFTKRLIYGKQEQSSCRKPLSLERSYLV